VYTSLDRIDIVSETGDGRALYVLTDHRTAQEILDERALSLVLAVSRVLVSRRHGEREGLDPEVRTAFQHAPPDELARAIVIAGGTVEVEGTRLELTAEGDPYALLDQAMAELARFVSAEEGIALDLDGLRAVERNTWALGFDREQDEVGYFTFLMRLAAVAGEVLRAQLGGGWAPDTEDFSFLPWTFVDGEGRLTNVLGRCQRLYAHGPDQGPSVLLQVVADRDVEAGPLMVSFKTPDYGGLERIVHEPLLPGEPAERMPQCAYGHDRPHTFQYLVPSQDQAPDFDALREQVGCNLADIEPQVDVIEVEDATLVVVSNHFYAAEKLLDRDFMRGLHARLQAEMLYASVPAKGLLFVMPAQADHTAAFITITESRFEESRSAGHELSSLPFLVSDGEVVGYARLKEDKEEPPRKKRGIFSWLWGGDA